MAQRRPPNLDDRTRISEIVRALRQERGLSQSELAQELGLSQNRLSEIERGGGSFTAEQFLRILRLFNVPLSRFQHVQPSSRDSLQKVLARLGAPQLVEDPNVLPSERIKDVQDAVRETLLDGAPRLVVALAPVLVGNARSLNLPQLYRLLYEVGREGRLAWLVDNTVHALDELLTRESKDHVSTKAYQEAVTHLRSFLDTISQRTPSKSDHGSDDILEIARSAQTLRTIEKASTQISRRWGIVSRLQQQDFVQALEAAFGSGR